MSQLLFSVTACSSNVHKSDKTLSQKTGTRLGCSRRRIETVWTPRRSRPKLRRCRKADLSSRRWPTDSASYVFAWCAARRLQLKRCSTSSSAWARSSAADSTSIRNWHRRRAASDHCPRPSGDDRRWTVNVPRTTQTYASASSETSAIRPAVTRSRCHSKSRLVATGLLQRCPSRPLWLSTLAPF